MESNKKVLWIIGGGFLMLCFLVSIVVILVSQHRQSGEQAKLLDQQQAKFAATATADPILNFLPYGGVGWRIDPTFELKDNKRTLVLVVSVVFYGSDYKLNPADMQSLINKNEATALNYINSKGFDPAKYTVEYSVPAH